MAPDIAVYKEYTATVRLAKTASGDFVYDLKQNLVGTCEIAVPHNAPSGSSLTLIHGEIFNETTKTVGNIFMGQTDTHIFDKDMTGKVKSVFTWHGFQFVQVHNNGTDFAGGPITCRFMHTKLDSIGNLKFFDDNSSNSSGSLLNQIHEMVLNSQRGNLAAWLPTDCPTREKHVGGIF